MKQAVSVILVTYDSAEDIVRALGSLRLQHAPVAEVIVIDNASRDESVKKVRRHWPKAQVVENAENRGFAAAVNQGLGLARSPYVLLMNPDVVLDAHCLGRLVTALERHPEAASACGKLWRFGGYNGKPVIDSAGMVITRSLRHLDRQAGRVDHGQVDRPARVFGASGALMLARREALFSVAIDGQVFDERFHSFREDADLAWRLQLAGYACIYDPRATAHHRRRVTPQVRAELPDWINRNSVRNRFLMRANNLTAGVWCKTALPTAVRDLLVIGACLTVERSSLPGLFEPLSDLKQLLKRRKAVQALKRDGVKLARWFGREVVEPLEPGEGICE